MEVMNFLDGLFTMFDGLVEALEHHGVYKVETIGGESRAQHARACVCVCPGESGWLAHHFVCVFVRVCVCPGENGWLAHHFVCVFVCVCPGESGWLAHHFVCVCLCVCLQVKVDGLHTILCVCVSVRVCV